MTLSELDAARAYARAWNTLDCTDFVALLTADAHYASQYVFDELKSRDEIAGYLAGKMDTVKRSGSIVRAELAKTSVSFSGKDCVALFQDDIKTVEAVVLFTVDGAQIARFDLCIPQLLGPILSGECPGYNDQ